MENYPSFSYPESGDSSPRSREIDFENPPPSWEEPPPFSSTHKVKFMVSYGGKIQPRSHDNLLSYVGGETKILAVDRSIKFNHIHSKLASLASLDSVDAFTFKYQLPGEDLDALISVTNDDDLEHLMHEYDRLFKASSKPARLRLFLFIDHQLLQRNSGGSGFSSLSSDKTGLDPEPGLGGKFIDSIISSAQNVVVSETSLAASPSPPPPPLPVHNNVDFLFGLDKVAAPVPGLVQPELAREVNRVQFSAQELHLHNLQQQQAAMFPTKNDENFGDPYQKSPSPVNIPVNVQIPQGYWQPIEQQQHQHQNHQPQQQIQQHQQFQQRQPVYMMHPPPPPQPQGNIYHAPVMPPTNQGYYQVPRMPVYSTPAKIPAVSAAALVRPGMMTTESAAAAAMVRPGMMTTESAGYSPMAYDGAAGRQVYFTTPQSQGGGVTVAYHGMTAAAAALVSDEMRSGGGDGKVVQKVGTSSTGVS